MDPGCLFEVFAMAFKDILLAVADLVFSLGTCQLTGRYCIERLHFKHRGGCLATSTVLTAACIGVRPGCPSRVNCRMHLAAELKGLVLVYPCE